MIQWNGTVSLVVPFFNKQWLLFLLQEIAEKFDVNAMPTFAFVKGGVEVHRIVGADKVELGKKVLELSASAAATSAA